MPRRILALVLVGSLAVARGAEPVPTGCWPPPWPERSACPRVNALLCSQPWKASSDSQRV